MTLAQSLCQKAIAARKEILGEQVQLPPVWSEASVLEDERVGNVAKTILEKLRQGVVSDHIKLHYDKDRREVSALFKQLLYLLSFTGDAKITRQILRLMETWNFSLDDQHCHFAMLAAARGENWSLASRTFLEHIDPNKSGYKPYDIEISDPVGLFALAKLAESENSSVVQSVMEAVQKLISVSPGDRDKYLLAAGYALGLVGRCDEFVQYLQESFDAKRFGQPLVASVMQSCLLCGEYDLAWGCFQQFVVKPLEDGGDSYYEGGVDLLSPFCRDVALCTAAAIGDIDVSMAFLDEIFSDESLVTVEALESVALMFESEGDINSAVTFFLRILKSDDIYSRVVEGASSLLVGNRGTVVSLSSVLVPIMRTCNSQNQPALSILLLRLLGKSKFFDSAGVSSDENVSQGITKTLFPLLLSQQGSELLSTTIVALDRLGHGTDARNLHDLLIDSDSSFSNPETESFLTMNRGVSPHSSFAAAMRHLDKVLEENTDPEILSTALALTVEAFVACRNASSAIYLSLWLDDDMIRVGETDVPRVMVEGSPRCGISPSEFLRTAGMEALLAIGDYQAVLDLHDPSSKSILSTNVALKSLIHMKMTTEALEFFSDALGEKLHNPETFSSIAKMLLEENRWNAALQVYRKALSLGCFSEELALIAMECIASSSVQGKLRMLRGVADDAASLVGVLQSTWLQSQYWTLKRKVGEVISRRLMYWEDDRWVLDELELALQSFEMRKRLNLQPKKSTLRSIISAAKTFKENYIPENEPGLPRVPRTRDRWVALFRESCDYASQEGMLDNPHAIHQVALGCANLGLFDLLDTIVGSALRQGIEVSPQTLELVTKLEDGNFESLKDDALFLLGKDTPDLVDNWN